MRSDIPRVDRSDRRVGAWPHSLLPPLALLLLWAGCSQHEPDLKLPPVQVVDDRAWGAPDTAPPDGYALLSAAQTRGVFPSAVAVAQLVPGRATASAARENRLWSISSLPNEQATYWNTLMTQVTGVREVVVLDREAGERPELDLDSLLRTASRSGADLCLAYGVTSDDPGDYRMGGVLFDAASRQKMAVIRAQAGPGDYEPAPADRHETDLRHRDPSYLCARKLQAHVRDCLLDLIARDQPAATRPSPWLGAAPTAAPVQQIIIVPQGG